MTPAVHCPHCDLELNAVMSQTKAPPKPGDLMVCRRCAIASRYTTDGSLRRLTKYDIAQLPRDSKALLMAAMLSVVKQNSGN